MSMILIRPMTKEDLDQVGEISAEAFSDPWTRESMEKEMENEAAHYLVAECAGDDEGKANESLVLGYVGYWQVLDEGHIMNVAVRKEARGQGVGTALVNAMLQSGDPLGIFYWTLEVRVSNAPAIHLYETAGFVSAGKRPNYYSHPKEDAYIYWLKKD